MDTRNILQVSVQPLARPIENNHFSDAPRLFHRRNVFIVDGNVIGTLAQLDARQAQAFPLLRQARTNMNPVRAYP